MGFWRASGRGLAFAGLWERLQGTQWWLASELRIITTEPNELTTTVYNRMPVILKPKDYPICGCSRRRVIVIDMSCPTGEKCGIVIVTTNLMQVALAKHIGAATYRSITGKTDQKGKFAVWDFWNIEPLKSKAREPGGSRRNLGRVELLI